MHKSDTQIVSRMYKELALINNKGQEKKKKQDFCRNLPKEDIQMANKGTKKWSTLFAI